MVFPDSALFRLSFTLSRPPRELIKTLFSEASGYCFAQTIPGFRLFRVHPVPRSEVPELLTSRHEFVRAQGISGGNSEARAVKVPAVCIGGLRGGVVACISLLILSGFAISRSSRAQLRVERSADVAESRWWSHVRYLADDRLQGRMAGSAGYRAAARYVVANFRRYGLEPAGSVGYFQQVGLISQTIFPRKSSLSLCDATNCRPLAIGADIIPGARIEQPRNVDAPLVFIGYGLHVPAEGYDDFRNQDLRGKIAVTVNGGPAELSDAVKAHVRFTEIWKALERAGAVGLINIPRPDSMEIPWSRTMKQITQPGMYLAATELRRTVGPRFTATFNPAQAAGLFEQIGRAHV